MKRVPSIGLMLVWILLLSGSQAMAQRIAANNTCKNVTDPGEIGFDQVLCAPGNNPDPLVSLRPASGGEGELEYLWMYSETDRTFNDATFKPIPNSNSETYDPGPLFRTTVFARCVRRAGCPNFLEPEVVVITVENEARADIIGPTVVCSEDTVTYEVETNTPNPELIKWTFPTGVRVIENTGRTVTIAFATYGQYNLSVMVTENGCTATGTKRIVATNNPAYCGMDLDPVVANFDYMDECGSLEVDFTNLSEGADSYEWWFDTSIDNDSVRSTATNPTYSYPAPGMYQVQLIAISNMGARDTIEKVVDVGDQFVDADFTYEYLGCGPNGIAINFEDNSTSSSPVIRREWTLKDGRSSTEDSPSFVFTNEGVTTVTLTVENEEGCVDVLTSMVMITFPDSLTRNLPDTLVICPGTSETINLILDPQYSYQWNPTTGISDPLSMRPVFSPEETTVYTLTAGLIGTGCTITDTMVALVPPPIGLTVDVEGAICAPDRLLEANTDQEATITWETTDGEVLATGPAYMPPLDTSFQIVVTATDRFGCTETQSIDYDSQPIGVNLPDTVTVCPGDEIDLMLESVGDSLTYSWAPSQLIASGGNTANPEIVADPGEYSLTVTATNPDGCMATDSTVLVIIGDNLDLNFQVDFDTCSNGTVQFINQSAGAFGYQWNFGDPNNPNAGSTLENPTYQYAEPGTYTVSLTLIYDAACVDTVMQAITIETFPIEIEIDQNFLSCTGGQATFQFIDLSTPAEQIESRAWVVSDGRDTIFGESPIISFAESGTFQVEAILTTLDGCVFRSTQTVEVRVPSWDMPDTLLVCDGSAVQLGDPNAVEPGFEYSWTPTAGLDDPTAAAPFAMPDQTTWYEVTIRSNDSLGCTLTDSVLVIVTDSLEVFIEGDTVLCGAPIALSASASAPATYQWFDTNGQLISENQQVAVFPDATATYVVVATGLGSSCTASDTIEVANRAIDIEVAPSQDTLVACPGESISVTVTNLDPLQNLTYTWSPDNMLLSQNGTAEPLFRVPDFAYTITGDVENQFGCTETITRYVEPALITDDIPDTVVACTGQNIELAPDANPEYSYSWSPPEGLSESTTNNPIFMGDTTTVYTVVITENISGLACEVTKEVVVVVGDTLDVRPLTTLPNVLCTGDSLELEVGVFPTQENVEITWYTDEELTNEVGSGSELTVLVQEGFQTYFAFAQNPDGCQGIVRYAFEGSSPACRLPYVDTLCPGSPTVLLLACDPEDLGFLTYQWSDTTDLDLTDPDRPVATIFTSRTYGLTITDTRTGCGQSGFVELNVFSEGLIDLGADTSICAPGDLTITAQTSGLNPATLSWYSLEEPGTPLGFGASVTIPIMDTFQLVAETNTNDGCLIRDTIEIRVGDFDPPLQDTVLACPGEAIGINPGGDPSLDYVWSPSQSLNLTVPSNPVTVLTDDQTYQVTITDPVRQCSITDEVFVDVLAESALSAGPDQEVCGLDSIELRATFNCVENLEWLDQNGNVIGSGPLITVPLQPGANSFLVVGTTLRGESITDIVTINNIILSIALPDTVIACIGTSTELNPERVGEGFNFRWSPITDLDDPMAVNPSVTLSMDETFRVTVTDPSSGCTVLDTVTAVIIDEPTIDAGPDLTVCAGASVTIEAQQQCLGLINWTDEAGNLLQVGPTLTIIPEGTINTYIVSGLSAIGNVVSDTVVVTVIGTQPDLPDQVLVCPDTPTPLNPNPDLDYTYAWSPANGLDDPISPNPSATITEDQEFVIMTQDTNGCIFQDTVRVSVRDGLDPGAKTPDTTVCTTDPVDLSVRPDSGVMVTWFADADRTILLAEGLDYTADLNEGRNVFYILLEDMVCGNTYEDSIDVTVNEFMVMLTDTVIACIGDPTPINPDGPTDGVTYEWSPNTGINDPNAANPLVALTEDQSYMVTVTETATGCVALDTVFVDVLEEPLVNAGPDTSACVGETIALTATTQCADQVLWTDGEGMTVGEGPQITVTVVSGSVQYIVIASTNSGREARDTVTVSGLGQPPAVADVVTVCPNTPAELNPGADPDYTYQWSPATGLNDPNVPNPMVTASMDQTYSVTATDTNGCTFTDEVEVDVRDGLALGDKSSDTTICAPETLTLFAEADSGVLLTWYADAALTNELGGGANLSVNPVTGRNVYYLEGVDTVCTTSFVDSVIITVLDFTVMLPDTVIACIDEPTPLNPDGPTDGLTYQWLPVDGLDDPNIANPSATLLSDQTYFVTIIDEETGCSGQDTVYVEVLDQPTIQAGMDVEACVGEMVTLTAVTECADRIEWTTEDGTLVGEGPEIIIEVVSGAVRYIATATNATGGVAADTVIVTGTGTPPIIGDEIEACPDTPTSLNPDADLDYTYQWSPADGLDDVTAANPQVTLSGDQTYSVTATDPNGCTFTDEVTVNVRDGISPGAKSADTTLCSPDPLTLFAEADSGVTISWYADAELDQILITGDSLDVNPVTGRNVYYFQGVDDVCSSSFTDSVVVTVLDFSVMLPDTVVVCLAEPTPLNPDPASPQLEYAWMPTLGLDDPTVANPTATLTDDQIYLVDITDPETGCTTRETVVVEVQFEPTVRAGEDQFACPGDSVTLMAEVDCASLVEWNLEDGTPIGTGPVITTLPATGINTYIVSAISNSGAIAFDTLVVEVGGIPPVVADSAFICADDPGGINPGADSNYTYRWSPAELLDDPTAPNPNATLTGDQLFTVEATDSNGCSYLDSVFVRIQPPVTIDGKTPDTLICAGDSATIRVVTDPGNTVTWTEGLPPDGLVLGEEASLNIQPGPGRMVYYVTVQDTVCGTSVLDSVVVTSPDFSVTLPPDTVYSCDGAPVGLHPMADSTFGYEWSPADQLDDPFAGNPNAFVGADQLFRVTITDPSGQCTYVDSTQVVFAELPDVTIQGDTVLCALEPLTIGAGGPAGLNWTWSTEPDFSTELTNDSTITIAAEVGDRTFYVRGMDPVTGCFGVDSIQVSYRPIMADLTVLDVACVDGDTVRVRVNNQDTLQDLTYMWSPEDLLVGGNPLAGPQVTYRVEGMVLAEVELTNQFGCTGLRTTELQPLNLNDQLTLEIEDSLLLPGESTVVEVFGCDDCAYEWFQDSVLMEDETESSILVSPEESVEIAVVVSKDGCLSDTLRVNITVSACEPPFVFVPSGFTPNGDGMNDFVKVFGEVILEEDFEFSIVARWGEEVYYSEDKDDQGWNGMFQGRELPPDVYAYVVQYRCAVDGELYLLKGNITLLR